MTSLPASQEVPGCDGIPCIPPGQYNLPVLDSNGNIVGKVLVEIDGLIQHEKVPGVFVIGIGIGPTGLIRVKPNDIVWSIAPSTTPNWIGARFRITIGIEGLVELRALDNAGNILLKHHVDGPYLPYPEPLTLEVSLPSPLVPSPIYAIEIEGLAVRTYDNLTLLDPEIEYEKCLEEIKLRYESCIKGGSLKRYAKGIMKLIKKCVKG